MLDWGIETSAWQLQSDSNKPHDSLWSQTVAPSKNLPLISFSYFPCSCNGNQLSVQKLLHVAPNFVLMWIPIIVVASTNTTSIMRHVACGIEKISLKNHRGRKSQFTKLSTSDVAHREQQITHSFLVPFVQV